jgi:Protein of unknown function (DUF3667)
MGTICKNCGHPAHEKYCSACGQKTATARFSFTQLFHDLAHGLLHLNHGILFTTKELLFRPGPTLKNYLAGQRVRYFNPFAFCVIIGGMNAYFLQKVHWQGIFVDMDIFKKQDVNHEIWDISLKYFTYRLLLSIPVLSLITFLFYYRKHLIFIEHVVANTYLRSEFWLLMIISEPIELLGNTHHIAVIMRLIILFTGLVYMGWAYAGLFNNLPPTKIQVLKGFLVSLAATGLDIFLVNILTRLS